MLLYKQSFYRVDVENSAGDVGAEKRAQMAKATMALCRTDGVLIATCCGGREASEPPEISLVFRAEEDAVAFLPQIQRALESQGLRAAIAMEEAVRYHTFGEEQLENIQRATRIEDLEKASRAVDICCTRLMEGVEAGSIRVVPDIPPSHVGEPFSITRAKYERMKTATGGEIQDEVRGLLAAFEGLSTETNTNAAVVMMIANGLLTIGRGMWSAYRSVPWNGTLTMWLGELIASVGGLHAIIPAAAAIAAVLALLFVLLKDVRNALVFLNGGNSEIELLCDFMLHGERKSVVTLVPAFFNELPKPSAYPCGLYVYKKHFLFNTPQITKDHTHPAVPVPLIKGFPIGFHGSTAGIALKHVSDGEVFSLGIDSPNLERNSVCIIAGDNAKHAAEIADDTATGEGILKVGNSTCTIRHASEWGSVNYSICTIDSERPSGVGQTGTATDELFPQIGRGPSFSRSTTSFVLISLGDGDQSDFLQAS